MEKRVNLFMQGMVLFISLLLSVLIAVSITTQREDENRELLEDIRLHQQAPDSSYQRLRRGPVEKPELYDTVILQENGEQVQYSLPKENFLYTYLSVLPITIMVMGVFVLSIPTVAKRFTTNTLDPVIDTMEEVRGILSGRETMPAKKVYPELEPYIKDIEYEKAQINYSMNKLIESEQMRRDFTANVSHELKTPLTSINGYAEMITSGLATDEDARRFAGVILSEGNRLLGLIDDTIRLSLLENENPTDLLRDEIDLLALAEDVVKKHSINAEERNIQLEVTGERAVIRGNLRMIEDAITNLVSNSIKYNVENGIVQVQTMTDSTRCYLLVKDTGIGISEEDQYRIFERFYMSNKARANKSGTGLGLSIVKHVIKLHNGEIELNSHLGEGTSIKIAFRKYKD